MADGNISRGRKLRHEKTQKKKEPAKLRVLSDGTGKGTKVMYKQTEIPYVTNVNFSVTGDNDAVLNLVLKVPATDIEVSLKDVKILLTDMDGESLGRISEGAQRRATIRERMRELSVQMEELRAELFQSQNSDYNDAQQELRPSRPLVAIESSGSTGGGGYIGNR